MSRDKKYSNWTVRSALLNAGGNLIINLIGLLKKGSNNSSLYIRQYLSQIIE